MRIRVVAIVLTTAWLAACIRATALPSPSAPGSSLPGQATPTSTPAATDSPAATASPATTTSAPSSQTASRCATSQPQITRGPMTGATGNEIASLTMINQSGSACYLGGYPGVELLDSSGHHLANAQWTTTSFFGTYPAPHRVDIAPGGTTSADLTWGGIDPCGNSPALRPAYLRITPPGDFDAVTISATPPGQTQMDVCPNSMAVHPVGSRPH